MNVDPSSPGILHIWDSLTALPVAFPGSENLPLEAKYLIGCSTLPQFYNTLRGILSPRTHCPFCFPDQLCQEKPIEQGQHFYLKKSDFPRNDCEMYLIIPKAHLTDRRDIVRGTRDEIFGLLDIAMGRYMAEAEGGVLLLRFGDPLQHVGTVPHLHFNIVASKPDRTVLLPTGKTEELWAKGYSSFHSWLRELSLCGGLEKLFEGT